MKTQYIITAMTLMFTPVSGFAAGDAATGKDKAFTCMGCHGIPSYSNVYPTYYVPRLAGQHAPYIVSALQAYKAGQRSHATMKAQASSLSQQDMEDIAAYFSTQAN
ncbi:MAG: cytochrome c [Gammaproteobacteria bacterium]